MCDPPDQKPRSTRARSPSEGLIGERFVPPVQTITVVPRNWRTPGSLIRYRASPDWIRGETVESASIPLLYFVYQSPRRCERMKPFRRQGGALPWDRLSELEAWYRVASRRYVAFVRLARHFSNPAHLCHNGCSLGHPPSQLRYPGTCRAAASHHLLYPAVAAMIPSD